MVCLTTFTNQKHAFWLTKHESIMWRITDYNTHTHTLYMNFLLSVPTVYLIEEYILSVDPFSISALQDALYKETSASYM